MGYEGCRLVVAISLALSGNRLYFDRMVVGVPGVGFNLRRVCFLYLCDFSFVFIIVERV